MGLSVRGDACDERGDVRAVPVSLLPIIDWACSKEAGMRQTSDAMRATNRETVPVCSRRRNYCGNETTKVSDNSVSFPPRAKRVLGVLVCHCGP